MARFSLLPKEEQYFSFFSQMTSYIYDAARALERYLATPELRLAGAFTHLAAAGPRAGAGAATWGWPCSRRRRASPRSCPSWA